MSQNIEITPKTIQIFLPTGDPRSIKIADLTSRTIQALYFKRSSLKEAMKRDEAKQVSVYFLFGETLESESQVYIGEAENFSKRVDDHQKSKDFWDQAVVISSKVKYFTKAHVKYLESKCYELAKRTDRFAVLNGNVPSEPYINEAEQADLDDFLDTINLLTSALGFPLLEPVDDDVSHAEVLTCKGPSCDAKGIYNQDGFIVLAGSRARSQTTQSIAKGVIKARDQLIESGVLVDDGESFVFQENTLFKSPSAASDICLGRSSNGWTEWKDQQGQTLDSKERS